MQSNAGLPSLCLKICPVLSPSSLQRKCNRAGSASCGHWSAVCSVLSCSLNHVHIRNMKFDECILLCAVWWRCEGSTVQGVLLLEFSSSCREHRQSPGWFLACATSDSRDRTARAPFQEIWNRWVCVRVCVHVHVCTYVLYVCVWETEWCLGSLQLLISWSYFAPYKVICIQVFT